MFAPGVLDLQMSRNTVDQDMGPFTICRPWMALAPRTTAHQQSASAIEVYHRLRLRCVRILDIYKDL